MTGRPHRIIKRRIHLAGSLLALATLWDILTDAIDNFRSNGDTNQAAALAFYAILSFIPLFMLTLLAAGLIFGSHPGIQERLIATIREFHPYFSGDFLMQVGRIEQTKKVLGWVGILSLVWFSAMIFNSLETSLDIIFRSKSKRNYILSKLLAVAMIPLGWAVAVTSIAITSIAAFVARYPLIAESGWLAATLVHGVLFRYVIPYLVMVAFFTFVYKVIPTGRVSLGGAFVGSALFSALMEAAKHLFTWYVAHYTRYDVIYGSLQTVVILVIWVFYVALILLFCAELVSSYQRRNLILLEKALMRKRKDRMKMNERLFKKFGRMYPEGSYVFQEGDRGNEMYYVLMGRVQVEKQAGQIRRVLTELGPGSYFGEMATLIDAPRTASVRAMENSDIAVIQADTFHRLIRESSAVSLMMLREFSHRVKNTNASLERLTKDWIRLVAVLYLLKEWPLPSGRDPVAELSGYTGKGTEEIQDVLKDMGEQGILEWDQGRVTGFARENAWQLLGAD
jgi:membrane protein